MTRNRITLVLIFNFIIITALFILPAYSSTGGRSYDRAGGPEQNIEVLLEVSEAPQVGETAVFTLSATPTLDAPKLKIRWDAPEGVEILEGTPEEEAGPVAAGTTVQRSLTVRVSEAGTARIAASVNYSPTPASAYGAAGVLFLTSETNYSTVSDRDPAMTKLNGMIIPGSEPTVRSLPRPAGIQDADFCVRIRGQITRKDKIPNLASTSDLVYAERTIPVTHAVVEVWEDDPVFDDYLGSASLNEDGEISYLICGEDDGLFDDELELYLDVVAAADRWDPDDGPQRVVTVWDKNEWAGLFSEYKFSTQITKVGTDRELIYDLNLEDNEGISGALNIVEAIFDAWEYFNARGGDNGWLTEDGVDVNWAPGWTSIWRDGSFYSWFWNEIYVTGDASDTDEWDDSVLVHEWAHFTDDLYSCDGDGGGDHYVDQILNTTLAFKEGYPDYFQSAVRDAYGVPFPEWYVDMDGSGNNCMVCIDLENWDTNYPDRARDGYELAVAALFWDLYDVANEDDDTLTLGQDPIQEVYTSNRYEDAGKCYLKGFFDAWADLGKPADAAVAAIITQNVDLTDVFEDTTALAGASTSSAAPGPQALPAAGEQTASQADPFPWWSRLALIVDNSASMNGAKMDAVKTAVQTQVTRLSGLATGVEFSLDLFNNTSANVQPVFTGQFFADRVNPILAGLSTETSADNDCSVNALNALQGAIDGRSQSDVWLFTDGPAAGDEGDVAGISRRLVKQKLRASFIALGLCTTAQQDPSAQPSTPNQQAWRAMLGTETVDPPDSIIPYLQIALTSGGQFLFVDESQMDQAAEILEAQITHSAGAGRWSDYVSDSRTYRWDVLPSWEYNWIDARSLGTDLGKPGGLTSEGHVDVTINTGNLFCRYRFYGTCVKTGHVYENGYITFDDFLGEQSINTPLPNPAAPNWVLYPFWDNLEWDSITLNAGGEQGNEEDYGSIFRHEQGDILAIEYYGFHPASGTATNSENFQVQFGLAGPIRFLYKNLEAGVGSATIGLEDGRTSDKRDAVQVSFNNPNAVASGGGFGFYSVPPQPSKAYTALVDPTMESIAFLLTGFSGSFDPLQITLPDSSVVNCSDNGVFCLEVGLVQYVQVNVDGRFGEWTAEVSARPSGSGTFNFTSMAVSPLIIESKSDHKLSPVGDNHFLIDLGQTVDGNETSGQLRRASDFDLGDPFPLFDDGQHDDGLAADGVFGSDPVPALDKGLVFLAVSGMVGGQPFRRVDPTPYSLPYLTIEGPETAVDSGSGINTNLTITNYHTVDHCYLSELKAPAGWKAGLDTGSTGKVCVPAGQSVPVHFTAKMDLSGDMPSGQSGVVLVTMVEEETGVQTDALALEITRLRSPSNLSITSDAGELPPGGAKTSLYVQVFDEQNYPVPDGTAVKLLTDLGSVTAEVSTVGGLATAEFSSGTQTGTATITAEAAGGLQDSIQIIIAQPEAALVSVEAAMETLPADGQSTSNVTATVTDRWGDPVPGQWVGLSVSGDGRHGTLDGEEGLILQSGENGLVQATYTSGVVGGTAVLQAALLSDDQSSTLAAARTIVTLQADERTLFLPLIIGDGS